MVDADHRDRGFCARNLCVGPLTTASEADKAVVAELNVEGFRPGFAFFMQSIRSMLVDINYIETAARQTVLMGVLGLINFDHALFSSKKSAEGKSLFVLSMTRPFGFIFCNPCHICGP